MTSQILEEGARVSPYSSEVYVLIGCVFDRCIKPNWYQSPDRFDPDAVLAQVRSLAVVPTVQMRNLGFPVWFPFNVFIERSCLQFKL